jgi:D-sedoheptulose 7-phosphate isomerase
MCCTLQSRIRDYVARHSNIVATLDIPAVERAIQMIIAAYDERRAVFTCGNGGSATTASHMAADLGKNSAMPGKARLRAISLTDNISWFSALANDIGYENVFVEQLANFLQPGDVLIAISASGNSPSIVKAAEYARANGGTVIGLVGFDGGKLKEIADIAVHSHIDDYGPVEDCHLMLDHIFVEALREHIRAG